MSLLNLTPDAKRLRRIAKACAAGEISRLEYRQARRQMIDRFNSQNSSANTTEFDDNTVPRFAADVTQRRSEAYFEPSTGQHQFRFYWLFLIVLGLLMVALPIWVQASTTIVALDQRDPNPRTSPVYLLDRVDWQVPDDLHAELSGEVEKFLAVGLAELKKTNAPARDGFNRAELEEVGRFLNAIGVHDKDTRLTSADLADLNALIANQKSRRGVSLFQLEHLAQNLQRWLRQKGYPLARAYVPAQVVGERVASLDVQLGVLRHVGVDAGADAALSYRLQGLLGKRVRRNSLETQLNLVNAMSGIRTQASFAAGESVGDTNMTLRVKQNQKYSGSVALDNYALAALGEERLSFIGHVNNLRGIGDVLTMQAMSTLDGGDHTYLGTSYATPIMAGRFDVEAQLAQADIELNSASNLSGDGKLFDVALKRTALFTRERRREYVLSMGLHDLDWDLVDGQSTSFFGLEVAGHRLWDTQKIALSGSAQLLFGTIDEARFGQDDNYWRIRATANLWTPFDLPIVQRRAKLIVDARVQYTNDHLPATLRMGMTGASANKGFTHGRLQLDRGIGVNTSLRFDMPHGQWWTFLDTSYGEQEGSRPGWYQLSSVGLGWQADIVVGGSDRLSSRITVGHPIAHKTARSFEDDGTQVFWSITYDH